MEPTSHLWAIGYPDMQRAAEVKDEIVHLGWEPPTSLALLDVAVVVRHPDGSFTVDRDAFPSASNILGMTAVGLLAGLVIAAPAAGAAVGALLGSAGTAFHRALRISDQFVREVEAMLQPASSALFVLDGAGDMDVILERIRGLGGRVLKTNVDGERAKLIQQTVSEGAAR